MPKAAKKAYRVLRVTKTVIVYIKTIIKVYNNPGVLRQIDRALYYKSARIDVRTQEDLLAEIDTENPLCQLILGLTLEWPIKALFKDGTFEDLMRVLPRLHIRAPQPQYIFRCYELPMTEVKVVIVGQDPYPGKDLRTKIPYACGRAFACPNDVVERPGSQQHLLEMIESDLGYKSTVKPDLQTWVDQGVLLCNASPTLHSYADRNKLVSSITTTVWTRFTEHMLKSVAVHNPNVIFVLFGKAAHGLEDSIKEAHVGAIILRSPHPSRRNKHSQPQPIFSAIEKIHGLLNIETIKW